MKPELPAISVVVPFKRSEWSVLDCLNSIFGMRYPIEKLEVIVVDDHSDDELAYAIGRCFPIAKLIRNPQPLGCDGSKQAAINVATGDILAITDADCTVGTLWARVIAKNLSNSADAVTGPVRHPKTFLRELTGICDFQDFQGRRRGRSNAFPGCNVAMHRGAQDLIRYQHSAGMRFGCDRLTSWRMFKKGSRIIYDPAMEVRHFPSVTFDGLMERRMRYGRKALILRRVDDTLPGAAITHFGPLAIPAYILYKTAKDIWSTLVMACKGTVNPWHIPLLIPMLLVCRIIDSFGIVSAIFSSSHPQAAKSIQR